MTQQTIYRRLERGRPESEVRQPLRSRNGADAQGAPPSAESGDLRPSAPPIGEGQVDGRRRAHLADLRRALVLSDVLGPPRALRGDGFR